MCKPVVYICGKVTGEHINQCNAKFQHAEDYLKTKGFDSVNPLKRVPKGTEWKEAMRICIAELQDCDKIFLLPDWTTSKGAQLEVKFAMDMGMELINGFNN